MEGNLQLVLRRRNRNRINHNLIRGLILQDIFGFPYNELQNMLDRRRLNLHNLEPAEYKVNFRFSQEDLQRLVRSLHIPNEIVTNSSHVVTGMEGLCILLKRLAYPNRLADLKNFFGRSTSALSEIANFVNTHIYNNFGHLLEDLNTLPWLNQNRMEQYANAIANRGAALANCWAFIDGTARAICRPSINQEEYYSGHKRFHCLKYQSVVTPDGLTVSCMGAFPGRRHDAGIFRESNLYEQLDQKARYDDGHTFVLYGDQAYGIRELLICPYPGRGLNEEQRNFNASMAPVREAVEWSFSKVVSEFAFVDFRKNQKLLLQDVEPMYKTLLSNCHSCVYGNQTAQFFDVEPIALEQYLNV